MAACGCRHSCRCCSRRHTQKPSLEAISVSRMHNFDRRGLLFFWQAIQRSKVLEEILEWSCRRFRRSPWRVKTTRGGATRHKRPRRERRLASTRQLCVCAAQVQMSTLIYEDVSTWSTMIPFHKGSLLRTPFFSGGLLSHYWLEILHTVRISSQGKTKQDKAKQNKKRQKKKHGSEKHGHLSIQSHLTTYCVLPWSTNISNVQTTVAQ